MTSIASADAMRAAPNEAIDKADQLGMEKFVSDHGLQT